MKKLLIIHHSSVIGGAGISLFNYIQLWRNDYDITVYVSDLFDDYYQFLKSHQVNVKTYNGRIAALYYHASSNGLYNKTFWHRLFLIPVQYRYWERIIKKNNPDLLIVNSLVLSWLGWITRKKSIMSLCFVRETFSNSKFNLVTKIQRKLLSKFTGVSFITDYDRMVARLPRGVSTFVNHNFIDLKDGFNSLGIKENKDFRILYIGGISKIKGINLVVEVAKLLNSYDNIYFDILGEDYKDIDTFIFNKCYKSNIRFVRKIKKTVIRNDLTNKLIFHGVQTEIHPFYQNCDIVIFPITKPHQQRGVFEAGFFSKPVIVPNFEQLKWAVKDDYNGKLFELNNAKDLADKILEFYNDKNKCKIQGQNNYKLTMENHIKDKCNEKILLTIKNILDD